MSQLGQMRGSLVHGAVVVGSFEMPVRQRIDWHAHDGHHQLAWAARGVLTVSVADPARTWIIPPTRALWIPARIKHAVEATRPATMQSLYLRARRCPIRWRAPTVVAARPLLRELIGYLARPELQAKRRSRAEALVVDLLEPLTVTTIDVPMPSDDRARRIAEALLEDPANAKTIGAWGRAVGASERTLARAFLRETGMSFGRWRTHLRVQAALVLLAAGRPVGEVAYAVGYQSPSAFVAAFRKLVGTSPAAYFAVSDGSHVGDRQQRHVHAA